MSLVFRENAKNRQNHGVFEGAVMGVNNFPRYLVFKKMGIFRFQVPLTKKIRYLSFKAKKILIFKVNQRHFSNLTV